MVSKLLGQHTRPPCGHRGYSKLQQVAAVIYPSKRAVRASPEAHKPAERYSLPTAQDGPDIWEYISSALSKLERASTREAPEDRPTVVADASSLMRKILYRVCDSSTVYPQISPDGDGGLSALWIAGDHVVGVVVDSDLDAFLIDRSVRGVRSFPVDLGRPDVIGEARRVLAELSMHVSQVNPQWRALLLGH
jgi:hypothetical protein